MKHDYLDEIHNFDIDLYRRTIFLHSQEYDHKGDGEDNGIDWKMSMKFIKNLHYLNKVGNDPIDVYMTSSGGDYYYGMAIYDAIKNSKSEINMYVYGYACSMASIILQAATKRYMSKNADFMIHYGDYSDKGSLPRVASTLSYYMTHNKTMFEIYAERCVNGEIFKNGNMTKENVADYLELQVKENSDWWLSATDAVKYGFADEVF